MKLQLAKGYITVLLGCMISLAIGRLALAWTTPVNISNTSGVSIFGSLVEDNLGNIHVVWQDNTYGNNEILYCFYNGIDWSSPYNISNDLTDSERTDITRDAFGQLHVVWQDYQLGEILWVCHNGLEWSSPVNISNSPGHSNCPCITADDSGNVFVVWYDIEGQSDIYFAVFDGTSWSMAQNLTDDPVDSAYPDIAVDSKGHVHLVWMDYADIDIYYSEYDGNSWTEPIDISPLPGWSCDPRIALDSQDNPHVIWEERKDGYHVYYAYYDGQAWSSPYEIADGHYPAIICGPNDNAHVVWGNDYIIYHSFGTDTSWSAPEDVSQSPEARCLCPEIQKIAGGNVHVIWDYWDEQFHSDIFHSHNGMTGIVQNEKRPSLKDFALEQNYPNPFNASSIITFHISETKLNRTVMKIFNVLGEEVATLVDQAQASGFYQVSWNGQDKFGNDVASGIYFCQLQVGDYRKVKKLLLIR